MMPGPRRAVRWLGGMLGLGACLNGLPACAQQSPDLTCVQLASLATVDVAYVDTQVREDHAQSVLQLKRLAQGNIQDHHTVYGLTHAEPELNYQFSLLFANTPDKKVCVVPNIRITSGFKDIKVYLASEVQDACKKVVIRDHEYEHVRAWKTHLRAGARLMTGPLLTAFSTPGTYASRTEAERLYPQLVEKTIQQWDERLKNHLAEAQRSIDSPLSYGLVEQRLQACP